MRCAGGPSRIWANTCSRRSCVGRQSIAGLATLLQTPALARFSKSQSRGAVHAAAAANPIGGPKRRCASVQRSNQRATQGLMDCCAKMALRDLRGTAPGTAQRFLDCANYGRGGENVQQPAGALPVLCCRCPRSSKHAPKTQSDWAMAPSE